jgi:anti-sigma B factor antagonist
MGYPHKVRPSNEKERSVEAAEPGHAAGPFSIRTEGRADVAVVTASGEIDLSTAEAFGRELERALAGGAQSVVLELERVSFIDSTGLTALLKEIERSNGRLRVVRSLSPAVKRTLEVSGLMDDLPWT